MRLQTLLTLGLSFMGPSIASGVTGFRNLRNLEENSLLDQNIAAFDGNLTQLSFMLNGKDEPRRGQQALVHLRNYLFDNRIGRLTATGQFPYCAWQVDFDPEFITPMLLDTNSIYHLQIFYYREGLDVIKISGRFPDVRYFSLQVYDNAGQPMDSFVDYELSPRNGKNPFSDSSCNDLDERGDYEVYLTRTGTMGFENELQFAYEEERMGFLMIRLYAHNHYADTAFDKWGGVAPPKIEYQASNGQFEEIQFCPSSSRNRVTSAIKSASNLLNGLQDVPSMACTVRNDYPDKVVRHFVPFGVGAEPQSVYDYMIFTNYDSKYLSWCSAVPDLGPNWVLRVTGTLPVTPDGFFQGHRISDSDTYQVRYISISTAEQVIPSNTLQSLMDSQIKEFYMSKAGDETWDGSYSIVIATDPSVLDQCGGLYNPSNDIFLAAHSDKEVDVRVPVVIYREILSNTRVTGQYGKNTESLVRTCDELIANGDTTACANFETGVPIAESVMGNIYPVAHVYTCDHATNTFIDRTQL